MRQIGFSANGRRCSSFSALLVISVAAVLLYSPFLANGLLFDDGNLFSSLAVYRYAQIPLDWNSRTFPYFTLGFTQVIFDSIEAHRVISLFLHICCAYMIFSLSRALLERTSGSKREDSDWLLRNAATILALLGALAFVLNPVAVYGAGYLVQRTIVFATLFSLLSLWYFQRAFSENQTTDVIAAAVLYGAAVFSKEHAIMLPFAALALIPIYDAGKNLNIKRAFLYLTLCAPFAIVVLLSKQYVVASPYEPDIASILPLIDGIWLLKYSWGTWLASILMQMGFFFDYIGYWFIPDIRLMSIDMRIDFTQLWTAWWFLPKVALYLVCPFIGAYLVWRRGATSMLGIGLLYSWLLFFTELVTVRFQEPFVLYRSYIWAPGYVLMGVGFLRAIPLRWGVIVSVPIFLAYFLLAQERLASMENEGLVWKDAAAKLDSRLTPGSGRILYNRGRQYLKEKKFKEAIADFSHAIAQNPKAYYAFYHRGTAHYALSDFVHARVDLDRALRLNKDFAPIHYSLGLLFEKIGCRENARLAYYESLRLGMPFATIAIKRLEEMNREKLSVSHHLTDDACA